MKSQTAFSLSGSLRQSADAISWNRREFLRMAVGIGAPAAMLAFSPLRALAVPRRKKAVVVTFGGGARDEETFSTDGQENIPHMLGTLAPQSTFYTEVVNHGILGHYVATASLATGVYETFDNFAVVPPPDPTVFEYYRRGLARPADDTWVVAPSNGFNRIGESDHRGWDKGVGIILPKQLLRAAPPTVSGHDYSDLLQDNYDMRILLCAALAGSEVGLRQLDQILRLSVSDFTHDALTLSSPDALFHAAGSETYQGSPVLGGTQAISVQA